MDKRPWHFGDVKGRQLVWGMGTASLRKQQGELPRKEGARRAQEQHGQRPCGGAGRGSRYLRPATRHCGRTGRAGGELRQGCGGGQVQKGCAGLTEEFAFYFRSR